MAKTRVIVTDFDDTLVKAYSEPTEAVKNLWNSIDKNIIKIVATGQPYNKIKGAFLTFGMELPNYIIADQGTVIFDTASNSIMEQFYLPNKDVETVLEQFYKTGGTPEFVRIYTGNMIVAHDCEAAHKFFKKTSQANIIYGTDIEHVIRNGKYCKVIMQSDNEHVDQLVLFSSNKNVLYSVNTGKTSYGECGYYRFEIMASDKRFALTHLLKSVLNFTTPGNDIDILCLGDEMSDFGLAQFALGANLYLGSIGKFAIINTETIGNKKLIEESTELAEILGVNKNKEDSQNQKSSKTDDEDKKIFVSSSIDEDGWKVAVEKWLNETTF